MPCAAATRAGRAPRSSWPPSTTGSSRGSRARSSMPRARRGRRRSGRCSSTPCRAGPRACVAPPSGAPIAAICSASLRPFAGRGRPRNRPTRRPRDAAYDPRDAGGDAQSACAQLPALAAPAHRLPVRVARGVVAAQAVGADPPSAREHPLRPRRLPGPGVQPLHPRRGVVHRRRPRRVPARVPRRGRRQRAGDDRHGDRLHLLGAHPVLDDDRHRRALPVRPDDDPRRRPAPLQGHHAPDARAGLRLPAADDRGRRRDHLEVHDHAQRRQARVHRRQLRGDQADPGLHRGRRRARATRRLLRPARRRAGRAAGPLAAAMAYAPPTADPPAPTPRAAAGGRASPPRGLLACAGLDHAHRGFETFARECFEALREHPGVRLELTKASGPRRAGEIVVPALLRDRRAARAIARVRSAEPFLVEHATFAAALAPVVSARRPDVVFFSEWHVGRVLAAWRAATRGRFALAVCNGALAPGGYGHLDVVQQLAPGAPGYGVAGGEAAERQVQLPLGVAMDRSLAPPDAALRARLGLPGGRAIVLSVGAVNRQKRMDYLVDEIASLPAPRPYLLIAGQAEAETPAIRRHALERLGPEGHDIRTVAPRAMADVYRAADAFVLASTWESFGRVLVEAQSHGL